MLTLKLLDGWERYTQPRWNCAGCGGDLGTDPIPNIQKQCYCVGKRMPTPAIFLEDTSTAVKVGESPFGFADADIRGSCGQPRDNWRFHHGDDANMIDLPQSGITYGAATSKAACFYACGEDSRCKQAVYYKVNRLCFPMAEASFSDSIGGANFDFISIHCNSEDESDADESDADVATSTAASEAPAARPYYTFGVYGNVESKFQSTPLQVEAFGGEGSASTSGGGEGAADGSDGSGLHLWEVVYNNCSTEHPYAMFGLDGFVVGGDANGTAAAKAGVEGLCSGFQTLNVGNIDKSPLSNFDFHFGELVVYSDPLEGSSRTQEVSLLKAKWGIGCPSNCHHCDGRGKCCYSEVDDLPWRDECAYTPPRLNPNSTAPLISLFTSLFKKKPAQQETISIPNMHKNIFFTHLHGDKSGVTYRLAFGAAASTARDGHIPPAEDEFDASDGPGAFFCHSTTASLAAVPYNLGAFRMWLIAADTNANPAAHGLAPRFAEVVVKVWDFEVQPSEEDLKLCSRKCEDSDNPLFGPNGKDCGPGQAVDGVPDDRSFTCDCTAVLFSGDNCGVDNGTVVDQFPTFTDGNDTGTV